MKIIFMSVIAVGLSEKAMFRQNQAIATGRGTDPARKAAKESASKGHALKNNFNDL
ncbi:hypothetical protein [Dryocola sp. BD613]|uniref:hypothetical protein n=1 Tax=Dryocola sp. BD613 TaxID=3133272 RepID=UPI003F503894